LVVGMVTSRPCSPFKQDANEDGARAADNSRARALNRAARDALLPPATEGGGSAAAAAARGDERRLDVPVVVLLEPKDRRRQLPPKFTSGEFDTEVPLDPETRAAVRCPPPRPTLWHP
jgi:hypothetical protein